MGPADEGMLFRRCLGIGESVGRLGAQKPSALWSIFHNNCGKKRRNLQPVEVVAPAKTQNLFLAMARSIASRTVSGAIGFGPVSMIFGWDFAWSMSGVSTVEGHTQQK